LEYFYTSPFFEKSSNNQELRTQGLSIDFLNQMKGIQYIIDDKNMNEPKLYVIKKINRTSPKSFVLVDIYYCLDGVLYQCPSLIDTFRARISKISHFLNKSFDELKNIDSQHKSQNDSKNEDVGSIKKRNVDDVTSDDDIEFLLPKCFKRKRILPNYTKTIEDLEKNLFSNESK
jgi:hypothetical protein